MRCESWQVSMFVCAAALLGAASAAAQTAASPKWEIEFHGGALFPANPSGGTVTLPPPGAVFATATAATPAPVSRRESSWYFGDGATLFNDAVEALGRLPGRITPLDPVLGRRLGERQRGGSLGVRVSRSLTARIAAELSVDYSLERLRITAANTDTIEAARASFIPAFSGMITFNPNRVLNTVTSTATVEGGSARQLVSSGAVLINLRTTGAVIPYATVGAGLLSLIGDMPGVTLRGNYQFRLGGGFPVNETDNVTVRDTRDRHAAAGILGGGVKYHVSPRLGVRLDVRVNISKASANTILDASPVVTLGLTPAGRGALAGDPSIQFSNTTESVTALGVTAAGTSSLTGPALSGFRTFSGRGVTTETNLTFGVFWRF